ncbi:MAG: hypothetical protein ABL895_01160 [Cyclobacteriaceae bacterium]
MTRKIMTILVLVLIGSLGFAQQKPKPKDKPPTQKEIDEMMREAQKEMEGLSEEEKKMMEGMGVKMPGLGSLPKFSDQQYQDALSEGEFTIPKKDQARISSVRMKPMSSSELTLYVKSTTAKVEQRMDAKKLAAGKEAYTAVKAKYKEPGAVSTAASGYWLLGVLQPAIYLMGRACQDDPTNPDHLNNYAAFLTMARTEELALPILINLNKDYPKNSTILNNMGHAWLGLGDVDRAEKYLDSAIALFPNHSQANFTKAMIAKSKGNNSEAITLLKKSITRAYSAEKQSSLKQLGYTLNGKDVPWNMPLPQDALGLSKFVWPGYPKNMDENKRLETEWGDFVEMCNKRKAELAAQRGKAESNFNATYSKNLQALAKGEGADVSMLSKKASIQLDYIMSSTEGSLMNILNREEEAMQDAVKNIAELEEIRDQEVRKVHKKFEPLMGEGKPNPFKDYCTALTSVRNTFLSSANSLLESRYKSYLRAMERVMNERAYYIQYTLPEDAVEAWKLNEKAKWLGYISSTHPVRFEPEDGVCKQVPLASKHAVTKLADFEDLHCPNVVELSVPTIISWRMACGKSHYEGGVGPVNFSLDYHDWKDEIIRGSVEIGASESIGVSSGPIKAELEGKLAGFIEFDKEGITDVGIIAGVEAKAGVEIKTGSEVIESVGGDMVSVGVTSRIGWNSGGSVNVFNN